MNGKLDPEEHVMGSPTIIEQVSLLAQKYGWEESDNIVVEMAGTQVSGIDVGEVYNKKWQSPIGTRKYNKDAFIIISNQSRRDLTRSLPMDREHKPHHFKSEKELAAELKKEDDAKGYDTYSK
jgi:hypothetical protein